LSSFHQVLLRVEAPGRVEQQVVDLARERGRDGIERDRGRVGPGRLLDDRDLQALGPERELLDRRGAERVAGAEEDLVALGAQMARELRDRRRLAGAVDPDDQDHGRPGRHLRELALAADQAPEQLLPQEGRHLVDGLDLPQLVALLELLDDRGPGRAEVGRVEHLLELVEERVVEVAPDREEPLQTAGDQLARLLEAGEDLAEDQAPHPSAVAAGGRGAALVLQILADAVEDAVDERPRVRGRVALAELDRLVDHDLRRHVRAVLELVDRHAQDVAVDRGHALDVPVAGHRREARVGRLARAPGSDHEPLRELGELLVLGRLREECVDLREDLVAAQIELVEELHREFSGERATADRGGHWRPALGQRA
jgi:hypothetical protein